MQQENQKIERISLKTIGQSILDNFNLNKGVLKTIKLLTIEPGKAIHTYFYEDRKHLIKSFRLLIATTAIAAVVTFIVMPIAMQSTVEEGQTMTDGVMQGFNMNLEKDLKAGEITPERAEEKREVMSSALKKLEYGFNQYFNIIMLLFVPLTAWMTYLFFRSAKFNFAEHLVINAYISSYNNILFLVLCPLIYLGVHGSFFLIYMLATTGYAFYFFYKTFNTTLVDSIFKGLGVLVVAYTIYYIIMGLAAFLILLLLVK